MCANPANAFRQIDRLSTDQVHRHQQSCHRSAIMSRDELLCAHDILAGGIAYFSAYRKSISENNNDACFTIIICCRATRLDLQHNPTIAGGDLIFNTLSLFRGIAIWRAVNFIFSCRAKRPLKCKAKPVVRSCLIDHASSRENDL